MAALPLIAVAHAPGLSDRLATMRDDATTLWRTTPAILPQLGPLQSWPRRWGNARAAKRLIDDLAQRIDTYPADTSLREAWRHSTCERLRGFGEARLGWPAGYRRLLFGDAFYKAATAFAQQARAFDPTLRLDDLWQALRNVWIGNSLQMLLGRPVVLTPGLFAYSMLYPVTDNVLDASDVSPADKRGFNERLGRRLLGDAVQARHEAEARAFHLVGTIEWALPRASHPDVWDSVLAIHHGQVASLRQQQAERLSEDALIECTVAKGGASVLADLYLVAGNATPAEARFAFRYGVFLQLLDDLQDVATDLQAGHQTLATRAARRGPLDDLASQLTRFIDVVLDACPPSSAAHAHSDCIDLIRRNCRTLLVAVIADQPRRFTSAFRRSVERQWPIGLAAMPRLRRRAIRRLQGTAGRSSDGRALVDRLLLES